MQKIALFLRNIASKDGHVQNTYMHMHPKTTELVINLKWNSQTEKPGEGVICDKKVV